jgi:hypothetical protein
MTTYREIQDWVRHRYGFVPQTCWIAHIKELHGLPLREAPNRRGGRAKPCPSERAEPIEDAFRHFGMLPRTGASR